MTDASAKSCFIAMPVRTTKEQAELYGDSEHWLHVLEHLFVPAVEEAGFEAWRPIAQGSEMIHAEIVRQLARADMVLGDMSHNNPNVFFELGVRTSVNKPMALVRCDAKAPIPFDVSGVNAYTYEPMLKPWNRDDQVAKLAEHLRRAEATSGAGNTMWTQFGMELTATEPSAAGSKEEAMLEVLSGQVQNLTREFSQLRHSSRSQRPRRPDDEVLRDFEGQGGVRTFASSTEFLSEVVDLAADRYNVDATVVPEVSGAQDVVLVHRYSDDAGYKKFRQAVREISGEGGIRLRILDSTDEGPDDTKI
ncbi:nucleoside 2-deoxyribosyltransferase [Pimelobacter sp. 30-1]|uniref:nucleoside 2-deoxyribosyltransferase n=1 Tax=Pimelobacter sp. 30-1 TaxID=2004991 RepID=UPI001C04C8EE|nr:nucleoside 2-deoxyribosyltransferase [Pimelobacter sp. 30-1]MBU2696211.1 hypothetical protein [Pimelobacter sp. 30-1]